MITIVDNLKSVYSPHDTKVLGLIPSYNKLSLKLEKNRTDNNCLDNYTWHKNFSSIKIYLTKQ